MVSMNKLQDPMKTAKIMQDFEKQNMKMDMTDEMSKLNYEKINSDSIIYLLYFSILLIFKLMT